MIKRYLEDIILAHLFKKKAIILYGARQVGKTTLVEALVKKLDKKTLLLNGDDADIRELFTNASASRLKPVINDYELVIIDEAQRIPEAALGIKIIHDNFRNVQVIVIG